MPEPETTGPDTTGPDTTGPEATGPETTAPSAGQPAAPSRSPVVLDSVALDTDEPLRLAEFYAALLGWEVLRTDDDWVEIGPAGHAAGMPGVTVRAPLAFQLVIGYTPPTWPTQDVPQQFHIDFNVADLDEGEAFAVSLGAERLQGAGVEGSFRVFLDPSGHPFCLCQA
jgi:catechol 2,3-dioxygenase-like lactoylglutathione lyase family enzyme